METSIILSGVSWDDYWDKMREIQQEKTYESSRPPEDRKLIRRKEARELLGGITDPTIIRYEKQGFVNPIRIGGTILYDRDEILKAADEHKQK